MLHIFVMNPKAGKMNPADLLTPPIKAAFASLDDSYEIYITKGRGDATRYVAKKCLQSGGAPLRFYSCGGDGTLHEVVQGLAAHPNAQLGLIPCGSGNDFIKMLPSELDYFNISAQAKGQTMPVDLLRVGDKYCLNVVNLGLDADAANYMTDFKRLPLVSGPMSYNLGLAKSLLMPLGHKLRLTIDDTEIIDGHFLLTVAANGSFYGGHFKCAPLARIDDGLLDLCLVRKMSRLKISDVIGDYKRGRHLDNPKFRDYIVYRRCSKVSIEAQKEICLCLDGEITRSTQIDIEVLPSALTVSLPAAAHPLKPFSRSLAAAQKGTNFG